MDNMKSEQLIMLEMKVMGMIKGDEKMEWVSPNNEFKFVFNRCENTLWNNDQDGHYIITIDVYNIVGVNILQLKFSEIHAMIILDSINSFLFGMDEQVGSNIYISIGCPNLKLEYKYLYLEWLYMNINDNTDQNILFEIRQYSSNNENMITMLSMVVSKALLEEFAFELFFYTLIDIELPFKYNDQLENTIQNLYIERNGVNKYFNNIE